MKKRILTCTVLAAMLFAACSKEEGAAASGPRSVVIDPTLLEMSKTTSAATRATDVDFETGDAIGLTITMADGGAVWADNARFSYAGGKFVSDAGLLWYEDIGLKSNLVAYYPYAETAPAEFTVKGDQSGENYTLSDLMIAAKSDVTPTLDATNMTFRHQLTKLVVNVNNQSGGEIVSVQVRNTVPTAVVDLATQTVAVKEGAAAAEITAAEKIAGKQYFAIVVPQTVAPQLAVTIRAAGVEKTLTQTYKELDMLRGQYTIAVNVLADKIDVTVTGDIEDWGDNGSWEVDDQVPFEEFEDYFLYDGELLDVLSKEGKAPGGYCTDFAAYKAPFIFSNFNGTSGDVDVLTHEAGHAFAFYRAARKGYLSSLMSPTMEGCETHSMSMEFLTAPWHEKFFGPATRKYEIGHCEDALIFIPYGCMVDEFQHIMYERPELTPDQRNEIWLELEKKYRPWIDYEDLPSYSRGARWQQQLHIYMNAFYYIDYCMAQTMAFQFWMASLENREEAWKKYLAFVDKGGTLTFEELAHGAGMKVPYDPGCIKEIGEAVSKWIDENPL